MKYGEDLLGNSSVGAERNKLMRYLPYYYQDNEIQFHVQSTILSELNLLYTSIYDLLDQLFVNTADFGLDMWDNMLGIPLSSSATIDTRKIAIIMKMRGLEVTRRDVLKSIAEGFSGGECEVIEYPYEYRFEIKFKSMRGKPPRLAELSNTVEELKPAHLGVDYVFTYATWYEAATYIWDEAKEYTWEQFRSLYPKFFWDPEAKTVWLHIYLAKDKLSWDMIGSMTWDELEVYKPEI